MFEKPKAKTKELVESSRETCEMFSKCGSIKTLVTTVLFVMATGPAFGALEKIQTGVGKIVTLIMSIAFLSGVIIVMYGAKKKIDGEPGAYYSIVGGALLALAPLIMWAIYQIFGLGDTVKGDAWSK
jgi:hypothetical protein